MPIHITAIGTAVAVYNEGQRIAGSANPKQAVLAVAVAVVDECLPPNIKAPLKCVTLIVACGSAIVTKDSRLLVACLSTTLGITKNIN